MSGRSTARIRTVARGGAALLLALAFARGERRREGRAPVAPAAPAAGGEGERRWWRRPLARMGAAAVAGAAATGFAAIMALELWNLSATIPHPPLVYDAIVAVRDASIENTADGVDVPAGFAPALTPAGVRLYADNCAACHGAPGVAPASFALGMNPVPPPIVSPGRTLPARELYWVIKNGLRMTGMPAWDVRLREDEMWAVTAAVLAMPEAKPADYRAALERAGAGDAGSADAPAGPLKAPSAERGHLAVRMYGCHSCHMIPDVVGPKVGVGPPLDEVARQSFIAGGIGNTGENLVRWIEDPDAMKPGTLMPDLGVPPDVARDIAAYLLEASPPPLPQPPREPPKR